MSNGNEEKDGRLLGLTIKEWAFFFSILLTFLTSVAGIYQGLRNSEATQAKVEQQTAVVEQIRTDTVQTAKVAADAAVEAKAQATDTKQQVQELSAKVVEQHDETVSALQGVMKKME